MITNKEELKEALKNIPKIENQMVSSMCSISVKELEEAVDRFKYIPSYEDLLEENNKFKNINEELKKESNDLRKLYQGTYKHLIDIGKDELARHLQAQINECPTFYVKPIIDYYEEYKRLNNIFNDLKKYVDENTFFSKSVMSGSSWQLLTYQSKFIEEIRKKVGLGEGK